MGEGLDWPRQATRWAQLTLTEDDPPHLDLDFWLGLMRESQANATCISAGGYIAYYPTQIPYHYRSKYLGDSDTFGALVEGARSLGMHVMARVDPHAIHADAAEAHPEWLARDEHGNPREHWSHQGVWLTCAFTTYHREFITEVAREIVREYGVDAVFANRWEGYYGISYSEAARRSFHDATNGLELPRDEQDDSWQPYVKWRRRELSKLVSLWDEAVRDVSPHSRFIPNLGSLGARDLDRELVERHSTYPAPAASGRTGPPRSFPFFVLDKQGRAGTEAPWASGRAGKRNRGVFPDRPTRLITSVGPEYREHRWKDSVAPPEETKTWIVDGFAQGTLPWFTKFNAKVPDRRWVGPVIEALRLHAKVEPDIRDLPITAEVAVLDPSTPRSSPHDDGFYHALLEARIPFELVSDTVLSPERLAPFRVLVLANAERLSDAQCQVIREYIAGGGGLVAAHESSLADENGNRRTDFGLADVFGARLTSPSRKVKNNYIALMEEHRLTEGYDGAGRIIGGTHILGIEAQQGTTVPFRFVPDFPDLPMEEVYAREAPRDPAVICRETGNGGGRVVYLAFDAGAVFWEALQADHGRLIANAVGWALGKQPEVTVDGPGLVDVAVRSDAGATAVALVNLSNPMAMRGAIRETLPLPPQRVSIAAEGRPVQRARLLVEGTEVEAVVRDGRVDVTVPMPGLLEIVHVEWGTQ